MPRPGGGVNRMRRGSHARPVPLVAELDVEALGPNLFEARSTSPRLRVAVPVPAGRWVEIRYRSGPLGDPIRPLLWMKDASGQQQAEIMPGPICGAASWVGRVPPGVTELQIEPVAQPGCFAFSIDRISILSRPALVRGAFRRNPGLTMHAVWLRLRAKRLRARHFIKAIWASDPFGRYATWLAEREAPLLPEPEPGRDAPEVTLLVDASKAEPGDVERTLASIRSQRPHPGHAVVVTQAAEVARAARNSGWIGVVEAGDTLAAAALAVMAAAACLDPAATVLYSDEDSIDAEGRRSSPRLKPDWSPRLQEALSYLGGLTLVRAEIRGLTQASGRRALAEHLVGAALAEPGAKVGHVRRILYHRASWPRPEPRPVARTHAAAARRPPVSIVVPNRDRLALLKPCLDGLRLRTSYREFDIVIVDNGSVEPDTHAFYASLRDDPRFTILERPGPFNFSALCNAGVAASRGEIVLLLNNDVEAIGSDWLEALVAEAMRPEVGAVGAKLLYPDGRLQHGGVVIGLGGAAGHIHRGRSGTGAGWMSRLLVPHEVSAVTGACLAVARAKYDAVGGLDEDLFPVSFNDIDLCLKLREGGWTNVMVPHAVLYHHESASRGRDDSGAKQARAEREAAHFARKWLHVMRDDPYFHPGLSLLRFEVSLG